MEEITTLRSKKHPLDAIIDSVETLTGYLFDDKEVDDVYAYTVRKCEVNGKGEDYIPILFENELRDYLMRAYINLRGRQNRMARMTASM